MPEEPAIELFNTIVPPFDISGNALVTVKKSPFTLTSNCASKKASSTSSAGAKRAMPAFAKRTSSRPKRCRTVAYSRSRSASLATSPAHAERARAELRQGAVQSLLGAPGDDYGGAFLHEASGGRESDACRAAGDDGNLVTEFLGHGGLLVGE
jgi:hypothetical protein